MQAGTAQLGRTILATIVAFMLVASVMFLLADPVSAASVAPEFIPGASNSDKTCSANEGAGQSWIELKSDPPGGGQLSDGTLTVTITNYTSNSFDWSSNIGVDAVIVKTGSDGTNLYRYDPPAEATGDTNLVTPGENAISHISFCYDQPDTTTTTVAPTTTQPEPTTTTLAPTTTTLAPTTTTLAPTTTTLAPTTTTLAPTTTTLAPTTTTLAPTTTTLAPTTTTVGPTTTTVEVGESTVTTAPEETTTTVEILDSTIANESTTTTIEDEVKGTEVLPFTGADSGMLALLAGALALLGSLILVATNRRAED